MTQKKNQTFAGFIKSLDLYGYPVGLSFEGSSKYKSVLGGVLSLVSTLTILAYFAVCIMNVVNKTPTIKNS